MTIRFDYPDSGSPSTSVVLGDVEQLPITRPTRVLQSAYETDSGAQVIYDWGDQRRAFTVNLWPLTDAQATALESFLLTTVNGRAEAFDYTDSNATVYTVRLQQDVIEFERRFPDRQRVALTLREV